MHDDGRFDAEFEAAAGEPAAAAQPEPMGLFQRLLNVMVSPGEAMRAVVAHPSWFAALALGGVLIAVGIALIPPEIFIENMQRRAAEQGGELPPGFGEGSGAMFRVFGILGSVLFWFIAAWVLSGLLTLLFAFVLGDEGRYRQYLAVWAHAQFVAALGQLVVTPLRISNRDPQLVLSVGTLLPFLGDGYLAALLGQLDLFGLWGWGLIAVGVHALNPKRSLAATTAIVMVFPVLFAAIGAIFVR
ncbi:MAG: hypothetical protein D6701_11600 [Gemmatimonadetes bacterium]|nr:MAG: hypothetical protein D6701_11600 [Gemmatimonadota bacterium]